MPIPTCSKFFETYLQTLMVSNKEIEFKCRRCVGVEKDEMTYHTYVNLTFGECKEIAFATDMVTAAMNQSNVVFYSVDQQNELIDFIYMDEKKHLHAFQATIGKDHGATAQSINDLEKKVKEHNLTVLLYYMVPDFRFGEFVTKPVKPKAKFDIWHVEVPESNKKVKIA